MRAFLARALVAVSNVSVIPRRQVVIGALIALAGGFGITKLAAALNLGQGVAAAALCCLIVGLLYVQLGRHPGAAGPPDRQP
jgi:hypothetical protein